MQVHYINSESQLNTLVLQADTLYVLTGNVTYAASTGIPVSSPSAVFDGRGYTITVAEGVTNLPGFFLGGCTVMNLNVAAASSALAIGGGWIFGPGVTGATVKGCSSSGAIPEGGGGILGSDCSGCTVDRCYSTGIIGVNAGGIVGQNVHNTNVTSSYSTGVNAADNGGGIYGPSANNCLAQNCFSSSGVGGVGGVGGIFTTSSTDCIVANCYTVNYSGLGGNTVSNSITGTKWQDTVAKRILIDSGSIWNVTGGDKVWSLQSTPPLNRKQRVYWPTSSELTADRKPCACACSRCSATRVYATNADRLRNIRCQIRKNSSQS